MRHLVLIIFIYLCDIRGAVEQEDVNNGSLDYSWKNKKSYYYSNIDMKMKEILNGKCLSSYIVRKDHEIIVPSDDSQIYATEVKAPRALHEWWRSFQRPQQMRVDPFLCDAVHLKKTPIFNNTGCQLPHYMNPSAPRCQTTYLKWACEKAKIPIDVHKPNYFVLPEADHAAAETPPQPWILTVRNAIVSLCGQISAKCGYVHTTANCMATGYRQKAISFHNSCPYSLIANKELFNHGKNITCAATAPFGSTAIYTERVFVVGEVDDTFVYHIHLEIIPRIAYHLEFLLANPDIKIMYGCDTMKGAAATNFGLRTGEKIMRMLLEVLGIDGNRLLTHQHVYAKEVYLPMEGACQDPVYNTWQILTMRRIIMKKLRLADTSVPVSWRHDSIAPLAGKNKTAGRSSSENTDILLRKPVMLLLKRSAQSVHTRNRFDLVRQWSDEFSFRIIAALQETFPQYSVVLYSDRNETLMKCFPCQIKEFARADVLIGVHGAGLGNMLYMKPTSAVVEFAPYGNDGRCLLGGGPFSRIAAVMSHNYMMHHPPYQEFIWLKKEMVSEFNVSRFITHIKSFLLSIGKY